MKRLLILLLLLPAYLFGQQNETEVSSYIQGLSAIHTETAYKALMDDVINESTVKKKDRIVTGSGSGSATLDYSVADMFKYTQSGNMSYTISNLANGQTGYMAVDKSASYTIDFTNTTVLLPFQTAYNYNSATSVLLKLVNKNGTIYTIPQGYYTDVLASETYLGSVEKATAAEAQAGTANKYIDAERFQDVTATTTRLGIVEEATLAELQAGTADKYPDAATIMQNIAVDNDDVYNYGLMKFATYAEANALISVDVAVSPGKIPTSTTTQQGVVELATSAETETGTSTTLAVTPAGLKSVIDVPSWSTLTTGVNWSGTNAVQYYKDAAGIVRLKFSGLARSGGSVAVGNTELIATLPANNRPQGNYVVPSVSVYVVGSGTPHYHNVIIETDGSISLQATPDAFFSGDEMAFEITFDAN